MYSIRTINAMKLKHYILKLLDVVNVVQLAIECKVNLEFMDPRSFWLTSELFQAGSVKFPNLFYLEQIGYAYDQRHQSPVSFCIGSRSFFLT
jgi:hypothetical protein